MAALKVGMEICERLITAATTRCSMPVPIPPPVIQTVHEPNWEGVTTSLTALSAAFVLGSIVVAVLAIIGGFAWAYVVRVQAVREACQAAEGEAKKIAEEFIRKWLEEKAPIVVREHVEMLAAVQLAGGGGGHGPAANPGGGQNPADAIGEAAGP